MDQSIHYIVYSIAMFYFGTVFMKGFLEDNILNGIMGLACAVIFVLFVGRG